MFLLGKIEGAAFASIGILALLAGCWAPIEYYLEGDPPANAQVELVVGERDSFVVAAGDPKRYRAIHVDWEIAPADFRRFPYRLAVENDETINVTSDSITSPKGQLDFLWECPRDRFMDTTTCAAATSHTAMIFASLPDGVRLLVGQAGGRYR